MQHGPVLLITLLAYIFSPSLIAWVTDPVSGWYKPFIVWIIVVIIAYLIQKHAKSQ